MPAKTVFVIRPLSLATGFELQCDHGAIMAEPLRVCRLFEAVVAAAQLGQGSDAEVKILNNQGQVAAVLDLKGPSSRQLVAA